MEKILNNNLPGVFPVRLVFERETNSINKPCQLTLEKLPFKNISQRIFNLRKSLGMDLPDFAAKVGLDEKLLAQVESSDSRIIDESKEDVLVAVAKIFPDYACYLMTGKVVQQKNPEVQKLEKELGVSGTKNGELIAQRVYVRWFRKHGNQ